MKHSCVGLPYWQVGATGFVPLVPEDDEEVDDDDVLPLVPDDEDDPFPLEPDDPPGLSTVPPHARPTTPLAASEARKRSRRREGEEVVMPSG